MQKKVDGQGSNTKMFMYSAHDATVAIVLQALGLYNGIPPPYAATVLLELHKVKDQHYVKVSGRWVCVCVCVWHGCVCGCKLLIFLLPTFSCVLEFPASPFLLNIWSFLSFLKVVNLFIYCN